MAFSTDTTDSDVQKLLDEPMHCIGIYIAAASVVCTLAMAGDALHGFQNKRYWCPSKYFSLNATCLALLTVTTKLPMDLNAQLHAVTDRLANLSSLALMSIAMANFMTSLGSMSNKDILMNVSALAILVITVVTNVIMQVVQVRSFLRGRVAFIEEMIVICCMVILMYMYCSLSLMILSTKQYLEAKYHDMDKDVSSEEDDVEMGRLLTNEKLQLLVKKYWVMAETSSPQFVIARSVTCVSSGIISVVVVVVLVGTLIRFGMEYPILELSNSSYEWATKWILLFQTSGVFVGTIAPLSRLFIAICFKHSNRNRKTIKEAFSIEAYWSMKIVEWKESSLSVQITHLKSRKAVHDLRGRILDLCILFQYMTVLSCKLVLLVSISVASPFLSSCEYFTNLKKLSQVREAGSSNSEIDVSRYVMLLEGEVELTETTLETIFSQVNMLIQKGEKRKPNNLLKLLRKSGNFNGVIDFDSNQVPSLHAQEPPYCWSLPIVTLTSIAIGLPRVKKSNSRVLLDGVSEGLSLVKHIEKSLDRRSGLKNIANAAEVVWVGVELNQKWQDNDLHESSLKGTHITNVLQELSSEAEKIVSEFKRGVKDNLMKNPLNWPSKVIAASAMYKISKTILLHFDVDDQTDETLFERISVMIADILSACLTNLARLITMKCQENTIEYRGQNVEDAALLLGETRDIIELLRQREYPTFLAPDRAAYIEEWRNHAAYIKDLSNQIIK